MVPLSQLTEGVLMHFYVLRASENYVLHIAIIFCVAAPFWAYGCVKRVTVYQLEEGGCGSRRGSCTSVSCHTDALILYEVTLSAQSN